jgi:hypothetical protein
LAISFRPFTSRRATTICRRATKADVRVLSFKQYISCRLVFESGLLVGPECGVLGLWVVVWDVAPQKINFPQLTSDIKPAPTFYLVATQRSRYVCIYLAQRTQEVKCLRPTLSLCCMEIHNSYAASGLCTYVCIYINLQMAQLAQPDYGRTQGSSTLEESPRALHISLTRTKIRQLSCHHQVSKVTASPASLLIWGLQPQFSKLIWGPVVPPLDLPTDTLWHPGSPMMTSNQGVYTSMTGHQGVHTSMTGPSRCPHLDDWAWRCTHLNDRSLSCGHLHEQSLRWKLEWLLLMTGRLPVTKRSYSS